MKYHIAAYAGLNAAGSTNLDTATVADTIFTTRNSHFIWTYPLDLRQAFAIGASLTDARFDSPSLASPSRQHIWPVQRSATVPSRPVGRNLVHYPIRLPQNEEVALQLSNNLGAATENEFGVIVCTPPGWTGNNSKGIPLNPGGPSQLDVKFTATITVANILWSSDVAITFAENLKGGWYAMLAASVVATSGIAYRFVFPNQMQGARQPYRPGGLITNALGDTPEEVHWGMNLGDMGYFDAFLPPTIQVLSVTGGGTAVTGFMRLAYLGDTPPGGIV